MIVTIVIHFERKKAIVTSGVMFLFFLVLFIFGILSFYTYVSQAVGVRSCVLYFVFEF